MMIESGRIGFLRVKPPKTPMSIDVDAFVWRSV